MEHQGAQGRRGRARPRAPIQIREKYETWKDIVAHSGPQGLAAIRGFNDEALAGKWERLPLVASAAEAYRVISPNRGRSGCSSSWKGFRSMTTASDYAPQRRHAKD